MYKRQGYGCLKKIGEIVQSFGVKKVLLCTDAFLLQTPAAHTIQRELEERGIGCVVYDQPQSEPTDVQCDEGAKFCKEQEVELIVALGGGSVMDQAKAMSAIVTNGLSCCQLDNVSIPKRMLPLICIPTTAGTGDVYKRQLERCTSSATRCTCNAASLRGISSSAAMYSRKRRPVRCV